VSEWSVSTLGDLCHKITDGAHHSPKEDVNGLPMFSVKDMKEQGFDYTKPKKISSEDFDKLIASGCQPSVGDILIAKDGSVMKHVFAVNKQADYVLLSSIAIIKPDSKKIDSRFLVYAIKSPDVTDTILNNYVSGSGVPRIVLKDFKKVEIQLPSIEEQKAIASVLSSLDDKIDLLNRQNTTLEAMAETLFRQWFVEEALEDWEERPLKEVCLINNGYAFQSETYKETGQKIIRTMNFNNHWIEFNNLVYISEELARSFDKYYLKRNDFLLVMVGASLGNFAIVTDDVIPSLQNQNMWCFRAHESTHQHYLNFAMRNIINDALHGASGSAREFFQKGVFYEIKIPTPPNELILKFHEISESYFSKIELNRKQIQTLEKLRDNLLPKLMSSEVRVN
jgi:type I restriction enzyme, S subunit